MVLVDYLADVAREMRAKSTAIRRDFATHRPSAGENRENLVQQFLFDHLPKRFGVSTGLVISHNGLFSNEADLVVVDDLSNAPLYAKAPNKLWPVESVYALLEVKTNLTPSNLADSIAKGRRFKTLPRTFCETVWPQNFFDSLYVIWGFDSPDPAAFRKNLLDALSDVPLTEQPDLVVVPDRLIARSGSYFELSKLGRPGSRYRMELEASHGPDLSALMPEAAEVRNLGENSLLGWFVWFDSWLRQAGLRLTDPLFYLPPEVTSGHSA